MFYRNGLAPIGNTTSGNRSELIDRTPAIVRPPGYAASMTATQEQFGSVKEDIRILGDTVLEIRETVNDHTYELSMIRVRLVAMETQVNRVNPRLDKVDGRLDGLETAVNGLRDSVNEILTLVRKSQ